MRDLHMHLLIWHSTGMNSYAEIFFSSLEDVFELCSDHLKDKKSAQLVYMWSSTSNIRDFSYAQGNTSSSFTTCRRSVQKRAQRCDFILKLLAWKPVHLQSTDCVSRRIPVLDQSMNTSLLIEEQHGFASVTMEESKIFHLLDVIPRMTMLQLNIHFKKLF